MCSWIKPNLQQMWTLHISTAIHRRCRSWCWRWQKAGAPKEKERSFWVENNFIHLWVSLVFWGLWRSSVCLCAVWVYRELYKKPSLQTQLLVNMELTQCPVIVIRTTYEPDYTYAVIEIMWKRMSIQITFYCQLFLNSRLQLRVLIFTKFFYLVQGKKVQ